MAKRLCAFDIERDRKGEALISGGWAVHTTDPACPETGACSAKQVGDLIEQLTLADILVGYNIIDPDIPDGADGYHLGSLAHCSQYYQFESQVERMLDHMEFWHH